MRERHISTQKKYNFNNHKQATMEQKMTESINANIEVNVELFRLIEMLRSISIMILWCSNFTAYPVPWHCFFR